MDTRVLLQNLNNQLEKPISNETLETLKRMLNYSEEKGFSAINKLLAVIKQQNDEDGLRCISIINTLKKFVIYSMESSVNSLPTKGSNGETLPLRKVLDYFETHYDGVTNQLNSSDIQTVENVSITDIIVNQPLVWNNNTFQEYLTVENGKVVRKYTNE